MIMHFVLTFCHTKGCKYIHVLRFLLTSKHLVKTTTCAQIPHYTGPHSTGISVAGPKNTFRFLVSHLEPFENPGYLRAVSTSLTICRTIFRHNCCTSAVASKLLPSSHNLFLRWKSRKEGVQSEHSCQTNNTRRCNRKCGVCGWLGLPQCCVMLYIKLQLPMDLQMYCNHS